MRVRCFQGVTDTRRRYQATLNHWRKGLDLRLAQQKVLTGHVIRMIDARQPLHIAMRAETVMSILGTATGRALAAAMPAERMGQTMSGRLGDPDTQRAPLLRHRDKELREAANEVASMGLYAP